MQFLAPVVSISYKLSITWIAEIIRTHFGQVNMHFVAADRLRQEIERQHCGWIYKLLSKNYEAYVILSKNRNQDLKPCSRIQDMALGDELSSYCELTIELDYQTVCSI